MRVSLAIGIAVIFVGCGTEKKSKPKPEPVKYNNLAVDQQQKGNIDSALYFINKSIEMDSSQYLTNFQQLQFLWQLDKNNEALITAKRISKIREFKNVSLEGMAYEKLGDIQNAMILYKQTVNNWPNKELEDHQSRLEYALLVTVVYGRERGLEAIDKIDKTKLPYRQDEVVDEMRKVISEFKGGGYLDLFLGKTIGATK